jgi:hypothetical protein
MALAPLATVADLEARGVTVGPSETAIVGTYLDVASTIVRDAAGCPIGAAVSTVTLEGVAATRIFLPGQPVTAVSDVEIDGVAVTDYRLTNGALWRSQGWTGLCEPAAVTLTMTHGLTTVPADIVDLVCRLAAQSLLAFRSGDPAPRQLTSERIGDYAVTYADTESGVMSLTPFQRNRLAARFGNGGPSMARFH